MFILTKTVNHDSHESIISKISEFCNACAKFISPERNKVNLKKESSLCNQMFEQSRKVGNLKIISSYIHDLQKKLLKTNSVFNPVETN